MQHRGISTEAITESAITIATNDGLDGLTMPRIAKQLGIKSQSLYNHVSNLAEVKTHMSIALFRSLKAQLLEGVLGLSGQQAIKAYFTTFYEFCLQRANLNQLLFLPGQQESAELNTSYQDVIQILRTLLAGIVTDAEQVQLYTRTFMSVFVGFVLNDANHFFKDQSKQGKEALDDMLTLLFATMK